MWQILEIGNAVVFGPSAHVSVLDGFTQSVAVRSAGFYINAPSALEPANQVLYVFMSVRAVRGWAVLTASSSQCTRSASPSAQRTCTRSERCTCMRLRIGADLPVASRSTASTASTPASPTCDSSAATSQFISPSSCHTTSGALGRHAPSLTARSIVLAVFVLCIIERDRLADPSSDTYFNIWSIVLCAHTTPSSADMAARRPRRVSERSDGPR